MKKLLLGAVICPSLLMAASAFSVTAEAQAPQLTPLVADTAVIRGTLPNGLTYIIRHNELPKGTAEFYIAQKVGATLEEDNQDGLAHFLEHMAFNGTKNFPGKGIINYFESVGVKFGQNINAFTSQDKTVYNLSAVPTTNPGVVDSALLVLHDWSNFISLEGPEIDKERGVIREEWRTGNSAARRMYFAHIANTMPGTRYATRDVIGDTAVINNFSYDALRAYYHKWYRPDLQGIVIVGDVDAKAMEERIKTMWADVPAPVNPAERTYFPVEIKNEPVISIVTDKEATAASVQLQFRYLPVPSHVRNTEEYSVRSVIAELACSVFNIRMAELVHSGAPIRGAALYDMPLTPTLNTWVAYVAPQNDKTAEAVELLMEEVEKFRRWGVNPGELQRAIEDMMKSMEDSYDNRNKVKNDEYVSDYYNCFLNDDVITAIAYDRDLLNRILPMISAEFVNSLIRQSLSVAPVLQVSAMEGDKGLLTADGYKSLLAEMANRDLKPYEDEVIDTRLVDNEPKGGKIKKWSDDKVYGGRIATLSNGIRVFMKPTTLADNQVLLGGWSHGGYSTIEMDNMTSASQASAICSQMGLGKFSVMELSKALTGKNASASTGIGLYTDGISGNCSKSNIEEMLQMVYLQFGEPRIDQAAYDAFMNRLKTRLANADKDPDNIFYDKLFKTMANGNKYSCRITSYADIAPINMEDAVKTYKSRFSSARGFDFAIVGSFDIDSIAPLVAKWLGSLPTGKRATKAVARGAYKPQEDTTVDFGVEMSTRKVSNAIIYSHKCKFDRRENIVLGALEDVLSMRYLESVREDEGGSYGVGVQSFISREPDAEYTLLVMFDTDPERYDDLVPIIAKEIAEIAENGPRADDLDKVKKHLIKSHKDGLQENGTWLGLYGSLILYDQHSNNYEEIVESISGDDLKAWAKRILTEANVTKVIMRPSNAQPTEAK